MSGRVLIKSGRTLGQVVYEPRVVDYQNPSAMAIANGLSPALAGLVTGDLLRMEATEKTTLGIFVNKRCRSVAGALVPARRLAYRKCRQSHAALAVHVL